MESYKELNLGEQKKSYMVLAALGFCIYGGILGLVNPAGLFHSLFESRAFPYFFLL